MNESVWWSFLYFMGEGRARDWGKSQVSQGQGEGQPSEKKQLSPDLEAQGAAIKKTPPAGKPGGGKEKTPASWKKPGGGDEKKSPDSLERAAQGQGQHTHAKPAKQTQTRADTKNEGGLRQPNN